MPPDAAAGGHNPLPMASSGAPGGGSFRERLSRCSGSQRCRNPVQNPVGSIQARNWFTGCPVCGFWRCSLRVSPRGPCPGLSGDTASWRVPCLNPSAGMPAGRFPNSDGVKKTGMYGPLHSGGSVRPDMMVRPQRPGVCGKPPIRRPAHDLRFRGQYRPPAAMQRAPGPSRKTATNTAPHRRQTWLT